METIIQQIKAEGFPLSWSDSLYVQSCYTLEQKGFLKKVTWGRSLIPGAGIGCFADESIHKGDRIRFCEEGKNMIVLRSVNDIPLVDGTYTLQYLKDNISYRDGFFRVCIPGSCINHSSDPNVNSEGYALRDIKRGEEILVSYKTWGNPPQWLVKFANKHGIQLPFEGYNNFV